MAAVVRHVVSCYMMPHELHGVGQIFDTRKELIRNGERVYSP